ncbi:hypothetical protein [Vibrio phage vB_VmeM-Yong XC32]|nr:hypothetical protein [Vibrio phage vB_VmeM-Yong XC31]QAX96530.1 hypothetical protein [Vibrio phage vB_VmeM-Yong XC32]QAX96848.1 hypothetical protein [Vibrio phage vB_VmeM-Yong MS31]QAX97153.1 hypothetical protein [Vibrio phage vB_VmeM-Yong MS32]
MKAVLNTANNTIVVGPMSEREWELAQDMTAANAQFFYDALLNITPSAIAFLQTPLGDFLELAAAGMSDIDGFREIVNDLDLAVIRKDGTPSLFSMNHFNESVNPSTNPALRAQQMMVYA